MNLGEACRAGVDVAVSVLAGVALGTITVFFFGSKPAGQAAGLVAVPTASTGHPAAGRELQSVLITNPEGSRPGLPVRLRIPRIKVDARIEQIGILPNGTMGTPKDSANSAWLASGPRPGETGSSVIDGHFGSKDSKPAAFDNLHVLRAGDKIYVDDDTGASAAFVVRETRTYGRSEDASAVFGSDDGKKRLNLITCEGVWSKAQKTYSDRLVVFSERE